MSAARLLLIEDDASLREILAMNLEDHGFVVDQASDGREGLARFDPERHDLVLTDLRMPGIDGFEVLERVRARDPRARVLVLTAFGGASHALEAVRRGAFHYVEKPVNTLALVTEIERALGGRERTPMVAASPAMNQVLRIVDKVAGSDAPVMILGESGVGKELVARALHERSPRKEEAFVAVNCAAIPKDLLESVLFGYEKGAFTGAHKRTDGKFTAASAGTLFLDEIAEMSIELQSKLLRVLQDGFVERVGSVQPEHVDVRVVTATHQDLAAAMERGAFRRDLYYRLHVVPITVPALRERPEDIPVLTRHFLRELGAGQEVTIAPELDQAFLRHDWPGNVRELRNVLERMLLLRDYNTLGLGDLPPELGQTSPQTPGGLPFALPPDGLDLRQLERDIILETLRMHRGNQSAAARYLHVPRHILVYRLEKFEITPDEYQDQRRSGELP